MAVKRIHPLPSSVAEVTRRLRYVQETGDFYWIVAPNNRTKAGSRAGKRDRNGYIMIKFNTVALCAHRLAWFVMTGGWPEEYIDHVDGNPSNNAWSNLRAATNSQNQAARRKGSGAFRGVTWNKKSRKWQAGIKVGGKSVHLGLYETPDAAATAYANAAKTYFGEFARPKWEAS